MNDKLFDALKTETNKPVNEEKPLTKTQTVQKFKNFLKAESIAGTHIDDVIGEALSDGFHDWISTANMNRHLDLLSEKDKDDAMAEMYNALTEAIGNYLLGKHK